MRDGAGGGGKVILIVRVVVQFFSGVILELELSFVH